MRDTIQVRGDVLFAFDNKELGDTTSYNYRFFHLNEFICRVEKNTQGLGDREVRYGIMRDFEGDESPYKRSYILEIPVSATNPIQREEEQEAIIKKYTDEMREKFQAYYEEVKKTETIDEFDFVKRRIESADGLWSILRNFKKKHLISFAEWLFEKQFEIKEEVTFHLTRSRMTFEADQEYLISTDWLSPYICFESGSEVAHFNATTKSEIIFYPFHGFKWQLNNLCTAVTIERDYDYMKKYSQGIKIKPNNYSLFAYYTHLIDNIYNLQQENYEEIKDYYTYASNLSIIQNLMLEYGPLAEYSAEGVTSLMEGGDSFDGNVSDGKKKDKHLKEFALGMADLTELSSTISGVIAQESVGGRNADRSARLQVMMHSLKEAFLNNETAQSSYFDLWAYNTDKFGFDLLMRKVMMIQMNSSDAEEIFSQYLIQGLYEHPVLEGIAQAKDSEWGDVFYRSNALTFEIWMGYYELWEKRIPPKTSDIQTKKLANYFLGGGKIEKINKIEKQLVSKVRNIDLSRLSQRQLNDLHNTLPEYKTELIKTNLPELKADVIAHAGNIAASALNLYLVTAAYSKLDDKSGTASTLRAHTVAVGLFSDVANTVARFRGIQATLQLSVARKAGGRIALALGAIQLIGGGVGGILGFTWFGIDASSNFEKGNRKDGILDSVSALGCAVTVVGLIFNASVVGIPFGVLCNVVGYSLILVSQLLKYLRALSNNTEDYCKHLYAGEFDKGGANQFSLWEKELEDGVVSLPGKGYLAENKQMLRELTERVNRFLSDIDTFDLVNPMPEN